MNVFCSGMRKLILRNTIGNRSTNDVEGHELNVQRADTLHGDDNIKMYGKTKKSVHTISIESTVYANNQG